MKTLVRSLFSPLLKKLETGPEITDYKQSNRTVLMVVSLLGLFLGSVVTYLSWGENIWESLIPIIVFGGLGFIGFIISWVGDDKAIAKIWGHQS